MLTLDLRAGSGLALKATWSTMVVRVRAIKPQTAPTFRWKTNYLMYESGHSYPLMHPLFGGYVTLSVKAAGAACLGRCAISQVEPAWWP